MMDTYPMIGGLKPGVFEISGGGCRYGYTVTP